MAFKLYEIRFFQYILKVIQNYGTLMKFKKNILKVKLNKYLHK